MAILFKNVKRRSIRNQLYVTTVERLHMVNAVRLLLVFIVEVNTQLPQKIAVGSSLKRKYRQSRLWKNSLLKKRGKKALDRQIRPGEFFSSVVRNMKSQQQQPPVPNSSHNINVDYKDNEPQCDVQKVDEQQVWNLKPVNLFLQRKSL